MKILKYLAEKMWLQMITIFSSIYHYSFTFFRSISIVLLKVHRMLLVNALFLYFEIKNQIVCL